MPNPDPIRIVDARLLARDRVNVDRVAGLVRKDLEALQRLQLQRLQDFKDSLSPRVREAIYGPEGGRPPKLRPPPSEEKVAGYVSNVRAWLYNETRRTKEVIVDTTAGAVTRQMFDSWVSGLKFNPNVFELSVATHARAYARGAMWDWVQQTEAMTALIVPSAKERRMRPAGTLARYLGRILKPQEWQQIARRISRDRSAGMAVTFSMGLHHGDFHQMVPVLTPDLPAARAILAEYRRRVMRRIEDDDDEG